MSTATHEDSDGTGYCRGCGTTIGEHHHVDCDVLEAKRLEADKARPKNAGNSPGRFRGQRRFASGCGNAMKAAPNGLMSRPATKD